MYRVNEIFYSLQGEGYWTGTPIVFVRFSGCNLQCPFCDTDHMGFTEMSAEEVLAAVKACGGECRRVCFTGGEPGLQLDDSLVEVFHAAGYFLHVETNGTRELPSAMDWVTLSPKDQVRGLRGNGTVVLKRADEIKLVLAPGVDPTPWASFDATWHFLQPCDENGVQNTAEVTAYIEAHPSWRLSLQTHKLLGIR